MKKTLRMLLDAVAEQRSKSSPAGDGDYCLHYGDLDRVEHFLLSFDEPGALSEKVALRAERVQVQDENFGLREDLKRLNDFENRMAGIERWLAVADPSLNLQQRFNRLGVAIDSLNERIDKVADIIGERVSGLVDEIAAVRDSAKRAHERIEDLRDHVGLNGTADGWTLGDKVLRLVDFASAQGFRMGSNTWPAPAFPTGGASTAEAAAEAVLPVPQRGDRVLIKSGTNTLGGAHLKEQWAGVVGLNGWMVQVELDSDTDTKSIPWISISDLKEVRHADQR